MKKYVCIIITLLLWQTQILAQVQQFQVGGQSQVQTQIHWTPDECVEYALKNNISVKKQKVALQRQQQSVDASVMSFLPVLSGSASQSFNFGRTASPENNIYTDLNTRYSNFGLSMSVPLTEQISNLQTLSMHKLNLKAALADYHRAEEDVRLNVISATLQVLYQKEIYEVAIGQSALSTELYRKNLSLKEYGKVTSTQVLESKAQMAQDKAALTESRNGYEQALLDLTQLLNLPSPEGFKIIPPVCGQNDDILSLSPDKIYARAVEINPGIEAEGHRLQGYKKNVSVMKSAYYP